MQTTDAAAYLAMQAALGAEADFTKTDRQYDGDGIELDAQFLRRLLLGLPATNAEHREIAKLCPGYEPFVPKAELAPFPLSRRGLHIVGATIRGVLDLSSVTAFGDGQPLCLSLERCQLLGNGVLDVDDESPHKMTSLRISGAHLSALSLKGSRASYICGRGVRIDGSLDISELAPLNMPLGNPCLDSPRRNDPNWRSTWPTDPREHCWCDFSAARIQGDLIAERAHLRAPPPRPLPSRQQHTLHDIRTCLLLSDCRIGGSLSAGFGSIIDGSIALDLAQVGGEVSLAEAMIRRGERDSAIAAHGAHIGSDLIMVGCKTSGVLQLVNAEVAGHLALGSASLHGEGKASMIAFGLSVGGSVQLERDFQLQRDFVAEGMIDLSRASVAGDFRVIGAQIATGPSAPRAAAASAATATDPEEHLRNSSALYARALRVEGTIFLNGNKFGAALDFRDASCATLYDAEDGYGGAATVRLDGMRYNRLAEPAMKASHHSGALATQRNNLLKREGVYRPQPYSQLARVLSLHGMEDEARILLRLMAHQELDHRCLKLAGARDGEKPRSRLLMSLERLLLAGRRAFGVFFGFGLCVRRAIATFIVLLLIGWCLFAFMNMRGVLVVSEQRSGATGSRLASAVPCGDTIMASLYAFDVFVPLIDLREEAKCDVGIARGASPFQGFDIPYSKALTQHQWTFGNEAAVSRYLKAIYATLGWIVTSLMIVTFTGVLKHRALQE